MSVCVYAWLALHFMSPTAGSLSSSHQLRYICDCSTNAVHSLLSLSYTGCGTTQNQLVSQLFIPSPPPPPPPPPPIGLLPLYIHVYMYVSLSSTLYLTTDVADTLRYLLAGSGEITLENIEVYTCTCTGKVTALGVLCCFALLFV